MKRYLLPLTLLSALAIAAPASAKEIVSAKVCGASGCHTETDRQKLVGFEGGGSDAQPPKSGTSFYTVTLTIKVEDARDKFTIAYLPSKGLIRSRGEGGAQLWVSIDAKTAALYDRLAQGLKPFPAARLGKISGPSSPVARVTEVVTPAAPVAPADGTSTWLILALAGGGLVVLTALAMGGRRLLSAERRARRSDPQARRSSTSASQSTP